MPYSDQDAQEVADILSKKIDYAAIERLVILLTHGEILTDEEHDLWRIRIIQMLYETYQLCLSYRSLQNEESMFFCHNQGYAGI